MSVFCIYLLRSGVLQYAATRVNIYVACAIHVLAEVILLPALSEVTSDSTKKLCLEMNIG